MIKSVTRSICELNNHQSTLDQVVLCIHQVMISRPSPLGKDDETIFLHNRRTTCSPAAFASSGGIRYYAFRMDLVVHVIRKVLNRSFSLQDVLRSVDDATWGQRGRCQFYDCSTNTWPIAHTVFDDLTSAATKVPLSENELTMEQVGYFKAVFLRKDKFDDIVDSVDKGASFDIDYKTIKIMSSHPDRGEYNFYEAAVGIDDEGWFGYRVLEYSSFGKYSGASNQLNIGGPVTELEFVTAIEAEHRAAGFGAIEKIYQPASLLEFYTYSFPNPDSLPPGLLKIPFVARNLDSDDHIDNDKPPWMSIMGYEIPSSPKQTQCASPPSGTRISPRRPVPRRMMDEQTDVSGGPPPNRRSPSSTPLGDATLRLNKNPHGPSVDVDERPLKRRRGSTSLVVDEAEAEGDDDEEVSLPPISNQRAPLSN